MAGQPRNSIRFLDHFLGENPRRVRAGYEARLSAQQLTLAAFALLLLPMVLDDPGLLCLAALLRHRAVLHAQRAVDPLFAYFEAFFFGHAVAPS